MDDIVKAAMAKWPHVPDCRGWLGLDARGRWYMRDDAVQAAGPFAVGPGDQQVACKGSWLQHEKLVEFIQRNYASDDKGQWFFQNGPQRVYVELEVAPYVWRVDPEGKVSAHTGAEARVLGVVLDESGRLYLHTDLGFGNVHTADMLHAVRPVEEGWWKPVEIPAIELPGKFGFVMSPQHAFREQLHSPAGP